MTMPMTVSSNDVEARRFLGGQIFGQLVLMALLLSSPTWAQSPGSEPEVLHPQSLKSEGTWRTGDVLLDQAPNLSFSFLSESTCDGCGVPQQTLADDFSVARSRCRSAAFGPNGMA